MSSVMCHFVFFLSFMDKVVDLVVGGSVFNGATPSTCATDRISHTAIIFVCATAIIFYTVPF